MVGKKPTHERNGHERFLEQARRQTRKRPPQPSPTSIATRKEEPWARNTTEESKRVRDALPESKYHYSRDDEFHKEGDKRDVGSASNTGGSSSNNDSTHNESPDESTDESPGSVQSNFDAPYDDNRNNRDDELDDFFGDLLSIKACIALAFEGLFKAFMSRSMKRIDFVAVTLMLLVCMRVIGAVFIDSSSLSELNAFAFVVALSALGICTISEKCPANALTALVIACLPALIEVVTACAVNGSDADAFNRITNWALVGCLGSAALLIAGTLIDPFSDEEEGEDEDASMDGGRGTSTSVNEGEGASMHEKSKPKRGRE